MKKHRYAPYKKTLAIVFSVLFFLTSLTGIISVAAMSEHDFYNRETEQRVHEEFYSKEISKHLKHILEHYKKSSEEQMSSKNPFENYRGTNLKLVLINDENGTVMDQTFHDETAFYTGIAYMIRMSGSKTLHITDTLPHGQEPFQKLLTLQAYIVEPGPNAEDIFSQNLQFFMMGYKFRYPIIAVASVSLIILTSLLLYLFSAAGHRPGEKNIRASIIEKIPSDLFTLAALAVIFLFVSLLRLTLLDGTLNILSYIIIFLCVTLIYLCVLLYMLSLAVRIKCATLFKSALIFRFCVWSGKKLTLVFRDLPLIAKAAVIIVIYFLFDLFALLLFEEKTGFFIYYTVKNCFAVLILFYICISLKKLQKGGERIANGDLSYQIDTENLFSDYVDFAETLNRIGNSMNEALNERIKSERMKTELITNVSHDIKTPLTSIINYVDLLKKEIPENEKSMEYLNILENQSSKLKKLICDLVEVSKAASGNIQINMEECDIGVLLHQAVGEYCEKLKNANLDPIPNIPDTPILIMADGNLLWRVFDNLLSNICKYAMPGTRVYLDVETHDNLCVIVFKNISASPLGVSCDELLERFVRGDISRHTEGSGLGLSIAKSLLELQNGTISLSSDGDLFKATVTFPIKSFLA
ncbi:MAG: sensor histidine kinase [Clostridia bacterium]|nr:sensor histidine kinase [Clostridia bacterium]